jgi:hypothetical protein
MTLTKVSAAWGNPEIESPHLLAQGQCQSMNVIVNVVVSVSVDDYDHDHAYDHDYGALIDRHCA